MEHMNRREMEFHLPVGYTDEGGQTARIGAVRKMTGRDEALLADKRYQRNGGKLVTALLQSCVTRLGDGKKPEAKDIAGWYSADRNYVLMQIRAFTFGNELEAKYACPACSRSFTVMERIDELPVKALGDGETPDDIVVELEDGFWDKNDVCHTSVTLRLPRGEDETAVATQMRSNPSLGKNALLARCIKSFGDMPRHRIEALGPKLLADLTLTDRRRIDRALNDAAPGVELLRHLECPSCGNEFRATLDMTHFFALE